MQSFGERSLKAAMRGPRAALGDTQTLRDLTSVRAFLGGRAVFAYLDLPFAPLFIGLLYFVDPALFFLTLAGTALLILIAFANHAFTKRLSEQADVNASAAILSAQSFVRNADTIMAMGMTGNVCRRWALREFAALSIQDRIAVLSTVSSEISRTCVSGAIGDTRPWRISYPLRGDDPAGMIFAASLILGRGLQPIDQVVAGWRGAMEARAAWRRLTAALAAARDGQAATRMPDPRGELHLDKVLVSLPGRNPNEPVLKRIEASIPAGQCLAIIGPSGAGKSMLVQTIVGNIVPNSGSVPIDGSKVMVGNRETLGRFIGYVHRNARSCLARLQKTSAVSTPIRQVKTSFAPRSGRRSTGHPTPPGRIRHADRSRLDAVVGRSAAAKSPCPRRFMHNPVSSFWMSRTPISTKMGTPHSRPHNAGEGGCGYGRHRHTSHGNRRESRLGHDAP